MINEYKNAMPIVHLVDPQGYKKIIYDALAKMMKLNLISFTSYDNKDYILLDKNGEFETYNISEDEKTRIHQMIDATPDDYEVAKAILTSLSEKHFSYYHTTKRLKS